MPPSLILNPYQHILLKQKTKEGKMQTVGGAGFSDRAADKLAQSRLRSDLERRKSVHGRLRPWH